MNIKLQSFTLQPNFLGLPGDSPEASRRDLKPITR
jgi:hypothetical protein